MSDDEIKDLQFCSDCRSTMLVTYFAFTKKGERYKTCDNCRAHRRERRKQPTTEKRKEYLKKYNLENKDKRRANSKKHYDENKEKCKEKNKAWTKNNKERMAELQRTYVYHRRHTDPEFKLLSNLRTRIWSAIKKGVKSASTMELVGCSIQELRKHLEDRFEEGMTWENQGEWHVDHIIPCASFKLLDPEQQKTCFHYTNLQPLWATENMQKSDKLDWVKQ